MAASAKGRMKKRAPADDGRRKNGRTKGARDKFNVESIAKVRAATEHGMLPHEFAYLSVGLKGYLPIEPWEVPILKRSGGAAVKAKVPMLGSDGKITNVVQWFFVFPVELRTDLLKSSFPYFASKKIAIEGPTQNILYAMLNPVLLAQMHKDQKIDLKAAVMGPLTTTPPVDASEYEQLMLEGHRVGK